MNITILLLAIVGAGMIGYVLGGFAQKGAPSIPNPPSPPEPRVIVNVPADFKPMETMPPTEIEGARAVLFYMVYSKAIEGFTRGGLYSLEADDEFEAYDSASKAVNTVFGKND